MSSAITPKLAYRIPHAAELLDIGKSQLYKLMEAGLVRYIFIASDRRVTHEEIERILAEGIPSTPANPKKSDKKNLVEG